MTHKTKNKSSKVNNRENKKNDMNRPTQNTSNKKLPAQYENFNGELIE